MPSSTIPSSLYYSADMSSIPRVLSELRNFLIHTITNDPDFTENIQSEVQTLHKSFILIFKILSNSTIVDKEEKLINLVKENACEYEYSDLQNLRLIVTRTLIELHKIKKETNLLANTKYGPQSSAVIV